MKLKSANSKRREFFKNSFKAGGLLAATLAFSNLHAQGAKTTQNNAQGAKMKKLQLTKKAQQQLDSRLAHIDAELVRLDSEFMESFLNFAYDEADSASALDEATKYKLRIAAVVANDGLAEFDSITQSALKAGVSAVEVKEILYQATPYLGYARIKGFLQASNALFARLNLSIPNEPRTTTTRENRAQKGLEIQREMFGDAIDKGNASAPADMKHIRDFLSANCFGDYYTRKGLDLRFRELLTFVILASLGGVESQVKAHVQGNINMGNNRKTLISAVTAILPFIGYPKTLNAFSAIDAIAPYKA